MEDEKKPLAVRRAVTVAAATAFLAVGAATAFGVTSTEAATPTALCQGTVRTVDHTNGKVLTRITPARVTPAPSCNDGCTNNGCT